MFRGQSQEQTSELVPSSLGARIARLGPCDTCLPGDVLLSVEYLFVSVLDRSPRCIAIAGLVGTSVPTRGASGNVFLHDETRAELALKRQNMSVATLMHERQLKQALYAGGNPTFIIIALYLGKKAKLVNLARKAPR
ncbi:unnamed protein product [Allacma fusca]|uniref:Uncharacterized protein n=1 Tax=Allacma fusca TaxID=39272 RepID=A0A8J2KGS1_9HEXA|nr:unnamed protein product [Allacma fusca]